MLAARQSRSPSAQPNEPLLNRYAPQVTGQPVGSELVVLGTGYVGLTSAACLAHLGHNVVGIDIDEAKVQALNAGTVTIFEPRLTALVAEGLAAGRLRFSLALDAVEAAPMIMLCLPTPADVDGSPDISTLREAVETIAPLLQPDAVLVTKSTVPIGTHTHIREWIGRDDVHLVSNPEFLREGSAVEDFLKPDRIVIGAEEQLAGGAIAYLYRDLDTVIHQTDPLSAELIKYASNSFLATKLSFVNEMARLCDEIGANIDAVTDGLAADHRISSAFLRPGPGWGGSCFPKDVQGLTHAAHASQLRMSVVEGTTASNEEHFEHLMHRIRSQCSVPLNDATIAVWGLAFKAGTGDVRSSPAVELAERLAAEQATVRAHDPVATLNAASITVGDMYDICDGAHVLVVATEWPQFASADMTRVARLLRDPVIFDTREIVNIAACTGAGLTVHRLGRPAVEPS